MKWIEMFGYEERGKLVVSEEWLLGKSRNFFMYDVENGRCVLFWDFLEYYFYSFWVLFGGIKLYCLKIFFGCLCLFLW